MRNWPLTVAIKNKGVRGVFVRMLSKYHHCERAVEKNTPLRWIDEEAC